MLDLFRIYQQFPYPLKVMAASVQGYRLSRWRYGRETERLVAEALDRESWNVERWRIWQEERLRDILRRAATMVPWYRDQWQKRRQSGDNASWEELENWPILEKQMVRNKPRAFLADDCDVHKMYVDHTGGTTGIPTLIYESRETVRQWYALSEARTRRWWGVSSAEKWGMFGGQKVIPLDQKNPPFWVMNHGLRQMYFSVFHITKQTARDYVKALQSFGPTHLIVYPSILAVLAHYMLEQRLQPPSIKTIICNSETLLDHHRRLIEDVFQCPIVNTYGMAELTAGGSECNFGTIHYWPESGIIEAYSPHEKRYITDNQEQGDLVMTGLLNKDMILVRYRNGDRGSLPKWDQTCACGRKLPVFSEIQGRANDLITTKDGKKLYILDSVFNGLPVVEAQLVQESLTCFSLKYVPLDNNDETLREKIDQVLNRYLGDVEVELFPMEHIPRDRNGKFKPFISKVIVDL